MPNFHAIEEKELMSKLRSNETGLKSSEAKSRITKYGKNELLEKKPINPLAIFIKQFHSFLIYILIVAATISYFFHHLIDMYVIIAVILVNAGIGFFEEYKAEGAIRSLKKLVVSYAKVYRDGEIIKIPAIFLVPGDIISLEEGDRIPADSRIINLKNLRTNESSLTGESTPIDKQILTLPENTQLADRKNMLYMGTFVSSGSCKAIVVSTGQSTVVGKLAKDIQQIKPGKTHFQKKSDLLAKQLGIIATVGAILTFLIGYFIRGLEFNEIFLFTIATLVSAIPEGLPAVLAIVLAIGAYRMSKKNALVRKLPSTETLGVVTTIITDKTGTLTENTMNVEKIILPGYPEISVTGSGWEPQGSFVQNKKNITPLENPQLSKLLHIATSCNASKILKEKNKYSIIGDPTEAALLVLAEKAGLKKDSLKEKTLDDLPFNPEVKFRASLSSEKDQKKVCVMGAPEAILSRSSHILKNGTKTQINLKLGEEISTQINSLTKKAMRVIALAYVDTKTESLTEKSVKDLVFVGLVGIRDPPRSEVSEAIDKAKHAGIRVIMATGDHKETALAIAKDIGLISKSENKVLTGQELEKLSKTEFTKTVRNTQVFARLTPNMKLKIATELQSQGEVIAMTGDGVNDAPALKKADVGISMGIIGTDVARDSSDIVLADDNFASIVNAIEEGRIVFMNTRQASAFLITTNIAELIVILITLTLRLPLPFLPIQILWINLVTGGGTDISLATETHKDHILSKKPRKAKENIFTKEMMPFLTLISAVIIVTTFFIFMLYLPQGIEKARTGAFVLISFTELFNVYNMRSLTKSIFKIGVFSNKWVNLATFVSLILLLGVLYIPFFQGIFQITTLTSTEFLSIVALSSLVLVAGELYKKLQK